MRNSDNSRTIDGFLPAGFSGSFDLWCARQESNLRPLASEANALSS